MPRATNPPPLHQLIHWNRSLRILIPLVCVFSSLLAAQAPEAIGQIEGDDIAVKGALSVQVENARSTTLLTSGSDVTVRTGWARLALAEGGEIGICGPAHFSLLKSGNALTLALDYGRVQARPEHSLVLTVYTPAIVATPIAVTEGHRDATLGLEPNGAMCVLATRGAVRIEQQFTRQSLLVPQSGEVVLSGGQLETVRGTTGSCHCGVLGAKADPPAEPKPLELSVPVAANPGQPMRPPTNNKNKTAEELRPPSIEEPIYKVMMPPLVFDAVSPAPPPGPSPETILLVRRVRVRPALVFRGRVEAPPEPPPGPPKEVAQIAVAAEDKPTKKEISFFGRVRNLFRRLTNRGECAGVGCG